jgi:hypothetical protein
VFRISYMLMFASFNGLKFKLTEACLVIAYLKTVPNVYPFIQSNVNSLASRLRKCVQVLAPSQI